MTQPNQKESITVSEQIRRAFFDTAAKKFYFHIVIPILYVTWIVIAIIYLNFWLGLLAGLLGVFLIIHIPSFLITARVYRRRMDAIREAEEFNSRMEAIRKKMTPAEWEIYLVQLENQRLLRGIRNSQNAPQTGVRYGFIQNIDD